MKKLKYTLIIISFILSHTMCFVVGFNYASIMCGIEHLGYSAPANLAFISAIPFIFGILICMCGIDMINRVLEDRAKNCKKDI